MTLGTRVEEHSKNPELSEKTEISVFQQAQLVMLQLIEEAPAVSESWRVRYSRPCIPHWRHGVHMQAIQEAAYLSGAAARTHIAQHIQPGQSTIYLSDPIERTDLQKAIGL